MGCSNLSLGARLPSQKAIVPNLTVVECSMVAKISSAHAQENCLKPLQQGYMHLKHGYINTSK